MTHYAPQGPLGLGGAPLGNLFARIPEEVAAATIEAAWDRGIRLFDTAPLYGAGLSEKRIGERLRHRPRDEFVLSTKVGRLLDADPSVPETLNNFVGGLPNRVRYDYSADGARRSIEASLRRLGLDRIDIVLIHDPAEDTHGPAWREHVETAMQGAAPVLTRLREEGVIRAWGFGVNLETPCLLALEQADPDIFLLAGRYTLLRHTALEKLFPACAARGVKVMVGGPYNSGLLAGGTTFDYQDAPAEMVRKARTIAGICAEFGVDVKAAALQFCAAHPVVAAIIPGARNPEEVIQNAALMHAPIPAALWTRLQREKLLPEAAPVPVAAVG
jgi:D-threo-aldose 1-dehydrogenase